MKRFIALILTLTSFAAVFCIPAEAKKVKKSGEYSCTFLQKGQKKQADTSYAKIVSFSKKKLKITGKVDFNYNDKYKKSKLTFAISKKCKYYKQVSSINDEGAYKLHTKKLSYKSFRKLCLSKTKIKDTIQLSWTVKKGKITKLRYYYLNELI